jgi:hypothetical protein
MSNLSFQIFILVCVLIAILLDDEGGGGRRARIPINR